jgi:hypothetical protein
MKRPNHAKPVLVLKEGGLSRACLFATTPVISFMVPYSVKVGGEYFFFGDSGAVDDFVSLRLEFAIDSPCGSLFGLGQIFICSFQNALFAAASL